MISFKNFIQYFLLISSLIFVFSCKKKDNSKVESTSNKPDNSITMVKPISSKIVCNKFDITWDIKGESLNFWLDTDLPDETDIFITVSRSYLEKGNPGTYSIDYFSEKSTVSKYRTPRQTTISDIKWKKALKEKQQKMAGLNLGFEVGKISNEIKIRFVAPLRQSSSKFGKDNINLEGKAVKKSGLRVVEKEIIIDKKLGGNYVSSPSISTSPLSLEIGRTYIISKKTPLMPELNPANPLEAINKMVELQPNSTIKILKSVKKDNSPWYYVDTKSRNGWINSTALFGQKLKVK